MHIRTHVRRARAEPQLALAVLLRESYRVGAKVKTRTLANLSGWPEARIQALARLLKDEAAPASAEPFAIERSLPHGHIAGVLGMARQLGLDRPLPHRPRRLAKLALAMIIARVVAPAPKLATARQLSEATAAHSLGAVPDLGQVDEDELDLALDLLAAAQPKIETALACRHLKGGCLVLYDLTSSYLEGRRCPLAHYGYSRDDKPGKLQTTYGLLCAADGCPVAVEVFDGNVGDPRTVAAQIAKLKDRFKLGRVVLVLGLQPTGLMGGWPLNGICVPKLGCRNTNRREPSMAEVTTIGLIWPRGSFRCTGLMRRAR